MTKETTKTKASVKKTSPKTAGRYIEAVGRRKTAVARVRLFEASKADYVINEDKDLSTYFPTNELKDIVKDPIVSSELPVKFKVTVHVSGGGIHAQAEAVRHGIARCLVKFDEELRKDIKKAGFLKRDPRMKERKKPGLRKARRAPQWSKR